MLKTPRAAVLAVLLSLSLLPGRGEARKYLDAINDADRAITGDLYSGRIVHAEPFGANGNAGSLWKVKIEHEGRTRWALLKPRAHGDRGGWARTPMEVAIYKLNRILGMDVVPPAAYRRWIHLPGGQYFDEGALIHWVEEAHLAHNVDRGLWRPKHEAFSSDIRVLAVLGRDADHENGANLMRGRHWADGRYRVMKVDNEACMRAGAYVNLEHNSASWGPVTRFNHHTYVRLKELNFNDLRGDLGPFLSDGEINQILNIRDGIVRHIDGQVRARGNERVFFAHEEIAYDARLKVGRPATARQLAKFQRLMRKKGVSVEHLAAGDARLKGALGRTVLRADGTITVRLARLGRRTPRLQTLMEELVHVNQLLSISRTAGLTSLHARLEGRGRQARAIRASMEAYAQGKVLHSVKRKAHKRKIGRSLRRYRQQVRRHAGAGVSPSRYWRTALKR